MAERRLRDCPVCGHAQAQPVHENKLAAIDGLDMSYTVARCANCGFHFAQSLPPDAQYGAYYKAVSKYDVASSVSALDRQRIEAAVALCAEQGVPKSAHIIDLGCGFGALLAGLRDAGWNRLEGLDPAPQSALRARELFGLDGIHCGTLAEAGELLDLQSADLVCLMAVLEHLPQLHQDLGNLIAHMRPGSRLLLEVPALEAFRSDAGEPLGELSMEHIQFFSAQSLCNLLGRLGARVLAQQVLDLPIVDSGSLFVLAEVGCAAPDAIQTESGAIFDAYLKGSAQRLSQALQRVPEQAFVLYGAGSHSARLLPALSEAQQSRIVAVLDGNPNLHGKRFSRWSVQAPEALASYPGLPVLLSSYRSERAIAAHLAARYANPLVLMYAPQRGINTAIPSIAEGAP